MSEERMHTWCKSLCRGAENNRIAYNIYYIVRANVYILLDCIRICEWCICETEWVCVCVCLPNISHRNTTIRSNTCLHIINKERFDVNHYYTTWINVYFANESISKWSYRFPASHPQSFRWLMDQSNERFKRAWIIHVLCDDRPNSEHWQKHVYPEHHVFACEWWKWILYGCLVRAITTIAERIYLSMSPIVDLFKRMLLWTA